MDDHPVTCGYGQCRVTALFYGPTIDGLAHNDTSPTHACADHIGGLAIIRRLPFGITEQPEGFPITVRRPGTVEVDEVAHAVLSEMWRAVEENPGNIVLTHVNNVRGEISPADWKNIEACVEACAHDDREPERYRKAYEATLAKIRAR